MADKKFNAYWDILIEHKFIEDIDGSSFRLHALFMPILSSNLRGVSIIEAITNSVHAYEPSMSPIESAIVSDFLSVYLSRESPELKQDLEWEMSLKTLLDPNPDMGKYKNLKTLQDAIDEIEKEKKLK